MEITTKLPSAIHSFNFSTSFKHYQFDSVYFSKKIPRLFLTLISSSKENLSLCNQQRRPVYFLSPLSYFSLDHKFKKRVHLLLRRTSGASARVPGPEEFLLPYPSFPLCSPLSLLSLVRYARSSRLGLRLRWKLQSRGVDARWWWLLLRTCGED